MTKQKIYGYIINFTDANRKPIIEEYTDKTWMEAEYYKIITYLAARGRQFVCTTFEVMDQMYIDGTVYSEHTKKFLNDKFGGFHGGK